MLRISKQADYGIVLLSYFAQKELGTTLTARDLSRESNLPLPTVAKILKLLAHGGVLQSHRGVHGGYQLARRAREVTVASIVEVLEGPIGVVECIPGVKKVCLHAPRCPVKGPLHRLNAIVRETLEGLSLRELVTSI